MLRDTADYSFGQDFARFMPLNDDQTLPIPDRIVGGIGPFDFSGESNPASIPFITKIDNGAAETVNIDLSGVAAIAAVTVDELFAAINLASPTDVVASKQAVTNRLFVEYNGTETPDYLQVYGAASLIGMIGQGLGAKFVKSDTVRVLTDTPILKEEETITTTDAKGLDTELLTDGYRKGATITITDTVNDDWELLQLIEGGTYDETAGTYETPTSEDAKIYFLIEIFYRKYTRGTNKEGDLVGYIRKFFRSCKGNIGDNTHERNWADGNYNITCTTYKDEFDNLIGDTQRKEYTVEEYKALDVYDV
jgi:hypothetical protein